MPAGYSRRRLVEKLDVKPGTKAHLRGAPSGYLDQLAPIPDGVVMRSTLRTPVDFIQAFFDSEHRLERDLPALRDALVPGGALWISWPKKASKVITDITEDTIREVVLPIGLVDVKVAAVSDIWSGLKLMIRKELR